MEKLQFDSGVKSYRLGGGVLRFHPGDPNLYIRFLEAAEKFKALEEELKKHLDSLNVQIQEVDDQLNNLYPGT